MIRPIITRTKMSVIKNQHFKRFFSDRKNVAMSSYKVDPKTNLPILYLKDQKEVLWHKFSEIYPNSMKRISFMAHISNKNVQVNICEILCTLFILFLLINSFFI